LLQQAGLPRERFGGDADAFFPARRVFAFPALAEELLDRGDLGCAVARDLDFTRFPAFSEALRSARTLRAALATLVRELRSDTNRMPVWLRPDARLVWLCFGQSVPRGTPGEQFVEQHDLVLFVRVIRRITHPSWTPPEIQLSRCRGERRSAIADCFPESRLRSGAFTALAIPRELLETSLPAEVQSLPPTSRRRPVPDDFVGSLRACLLATLEAGAPAGIDAAAELLGSSVRTLQRRLSETGISYSAVLDRLRYEMALDLLEHTDDSVASIAAQVGYSDPAHFSRAFRRWAATTPRSARRALRQQKDPC
jgi:AraC-like DNA-binding protein